MSVIVAVKLALAVSATVDTCRKHTRIWSHLAVRAGPVIMTFAYSVCAFPVRTTADILARVDFLFTLAPRWEAV